jgi:hypothetical protein
MRILRPDEITPEIMAALEFRELTPEESKEAYALMRADLAAEMERADMKRIELEDITPDFLANLKYSHFGPARVEEIIALAKTKYTPEDLQRHLDRNDGISADEVLRELEEMH